MQAYISRSLDDLVKFQRESQKKSGKQQNFVKNKQNRDNAANRANTNSRKWKATKNRNALDWRRKRNAAQNAMFVAKSIEKSQAVNKTMVLPRSLKRRVEQTKPFQVKRKQAFSTNRRPLNAYNLQRGAKMTARNKRQRISLTGINSKGPSAKAQAANANTLAFTGNMKTLSGKQKRLSRNAQQRLMNNRTVSKTIRKKPFNGRNIVNVGNTRNASNAEITQMTRKQRNLRLVPRRTNLLFPFTQNKSNLKSFNISLMRSKGIKLGRQKPQSKVMLKNLARANKAQNAFTQRESFNAPAFDTQMLSNIKIMTSLDKVPAPLLAQQQMPMDVPQDFY